MPEICFLGKPLKIEVRPCPLGRSRIRENEGCLTVNVPAGRESHVAPADILRQVEEWLRSQARKVLNERSFRVAQDFGVGINRIAIKDTVTRWGSCSQKGNLNFNWRLIMAPSHIIDYLVVHEIAHLRELNHSAAFWSLVREKCPDYRNHIAWLKSCGGKLFSAFTSGASGRS